MEKILNAVSNKNIVEFGQECKVKMDAIFETKMQNLKKESLQKIFGKQPEPE